MKIIKFRYLNTNDSYDLKFKWCSRVYEYPAVLNFLENIRTNDMTIHNTAAGYGNEIWDLQLKFFDELRNRFPSIKNSDINSMPEYGIEKFNIVYDKDEIQYDIVMNISVIEHLPVEEQIPALDNLWSNVKPNGYFILTFDSPPVDLSMIEKWCGCQCEMKPINAVNGENSIYSQPQYIGYNFILLIIQKTQ